MPRPAASPTGRATVPEPASLSTAGEWPGGSPARGPGPASQATQAAVDHDAARPAAAPASRAAAATGSFTASDSAPGVTVTARSP